MTLDQYSVSVHSARSPVHRGSRGGGGRPGSDRARHSGSPISISTGYSYISPLALRGSVLELEAILEHKEPFTNKSKILTR